MNDGIVLFLPHVNYSEEYTTIRSMDGERLLQQGLAEIKGVGEKAAEIIREEREKNGIFRSKDDFIDRCRSRAVTIRTINLLEESGAIEFNKKTYINRVTKYNSAIYSRALRKRN